MGDMDAPLPEAAVAKPNGVQPVVQFAASTFYVREGERLRVVVQRLGPCASATSSVDWATKPSPYEGKKFKACRGTLTFPPGELFSEFIIALLDDNDFASTLQFRVGLSNPIGCTIGADAASVMIQDNDVFPSNRYKEKIEEDRTTESWREGESWNMFKQWAKFIFRYTPGSKKVLLADQIDNIIFIIEVVVMRLLVNALSTDEAGHWIRFLRTVSGKAVDGRVKSSELHTTIICFGLIILVPYVITHWLMYKRTTWKVTGGARAVLQENLLRKYLSQDESRSFSSTTFFLDSFGHDVGYLVVNGYNKLFAVAKSIGRLLIVLALTLYYGFQARMEKNVNLAFMGLVPFLVLPICIFIILVVRRKLNLKAVRAVFDTEDAMLAKVDASTDCYRMVADMETRTLVVSDCLQDVTKLNAAIAKLAGLMANNRSMVQWVTEVLKFLWIVIAGHAVVASLTAADEETMDLGLFLAILQLIESNGAQFENLYETWLSLQENYPSLWNLVMLMNLGSDVNARIQQQSVRLNLGVTLAKEVHTKLMQADLDGSVFPEDSLPLTFENISFTYPGQNKPQVDGFNKQIQQGSLIAFTGPRGSGKSTILKLMGEVLMPLTGKISIPPHLRILHVSAESMIWPGTVAENIFLGVCASHGIKTDEYATLDRQTLERGWHVCRVLNFPPHLQELAEDLETQKAFDHFTLPASHKKLIHLARAFISNPEVLVVHEPTFYLDEDLRIVVANALKEFVKLRGLVPDGQKQESRRPRTVLVSSTEPLDLKHADDIIHMESVHDDATTVRIRWCHI